MSKYYKTVIQVEVLSDEPFVDIVGDPIRDLTHINYQITCGDCSGKVECISHEELTQEQMAEALEAQGSDPSLLIPEEDLEEME